MRLAVSCGHAYEIQLLASHESAGLSNAKLNKEEKPHE
jgi:hypothetical protein